MQMTYLLDTHVWYWLVESPEKIPVKVRKSLQQKGSVPFGVSSISLWEIAKLEENRRITFNVPLDFWMHEALDPEFIRRVDMDERVAIESTRLPEGFHSDPADQIIVATARVHNLTLITADQKILDYPHVKSLWS